MGKQINALLLDERDNVVTCVREVSKGEQVIYLQGDEYLEVTAEETIPYCHKIALKDFAAEEEVFKYGEVIGKTSETIKKGHWVAHHNIYSVPRNYEEEYI